MPVETRPRPTDRRARAWIAAGLALSVLVVAPWPAAAADEPAPEPPVEEPTPTPETEPTPPTTVTEKVLVYRSRSMVKQFTNYWCVPAATQAMLNHVLDRSDRSYATQRRYYRAIRRHNRYTYATRGNDPQGWAWGLRYFSGRTTSYYARSFTHKGKAIAAIADSIARTKEPVGVLVHRGTHAWMAVGYKAKVDPNDPSKRTVLGFYVSGPLGSPSDPWPYQYMKVETFRKHFSLYHEWQRRVIWEKKWVIVSQ